MSLQSIRIVDFQPHIGSGFRIVSPDAEIDTLELIEANDLTVKGASRQDGVRSDPFRLVFRSGDREKYLPQQIIRMTHSDLGELAIFLVPIGPDSEGMRYEAIFN